MVCLILNTHKYVHRNAYYSQCITYVNVLNIFPWNRKISDLFLSLQEMRRKVEEMQRQLQERKNKLRATEDTAEKKGNVVEKVNKILNMKVRFVFLVPTYKRV